MNCAAEAPRLDLISESQRRDRASGGQGGDARRRGERFNGAKQIRQIRENDGGWPRGGRNKPGGERQDKDGRGDGGASGILTAGHGARRHAGHIVAAIHMIRGGSRCVAIMVPVDRALIGDAACGFVGGPRGSRQRRIEENDGKQTDACEKRTPAILAASGHLNAKPCNYHTLKRFFMQQTDGCRFCFRLLAGEEERPFEP